MDMDPFYLNPDEKDKFQHYQLVLVIYINKQTHVFLEKYTFSPYFLASSFLT